MDPSHFMMLNPGKSQRKPMPLGDITQYVNPDIHGDAIARGAFDSLQDEHSKKDTAGKYKTVMCRSWIQGGSCNYGTKCRFAHGEKELRPPSRQCSNKIKTKACEKYTGEGICVYGDRCNYIHPQKGPNGAQFCQYPYMMPPFPMGYPVYGMPGMGGMYGAPQFIPPPLMAVPSFPGYVGDMSHFYGHIPAGLESVKQQNACKKPASGHKSLLPLVFRNDTGMDSVAHSDDHKNHPLSSIQNIGKESKCPCTPPLVPFGSSLGSDIWSPEKRNPAFDLSPDRVSIVEVEDKPLRFSPSAPADGSPVREGDVPAGGVNGNWIADLAKNKPICEFGGFGLLDSDIVANNEKNGFETGTANSECSSEDRFFGELPNVDLSWLWKH